MSDFDELDSLLGPLREPATPAELASEREMVDLMAKTHRHAKGTPMFSSRRARVATLIAAGVIGFGGVAAAGGGLGLNDSGSTPDVNPEIEVEEIEIEEVEVEEIEVEIEEVEEVEVEEVEVEEIDDDTFAEEIAKITPAVVAEATAVDDLETDFNEERCLPGNHGKTVSAVAHGDEAFEDVEVRDAAHSQCGKTDDETGEVADDDAGEVESDDDTADDSDDDESDDDADSDDDSDDDSAEDHGSGNRPEAPGRGESRGDRGNGGHGKPGDDD